MSPSQPSVIQGKLFETNGDFVTSATLTLTHSSGTLSNTSNDSGEYQFNLGNLSSWSVGDSISISANKAGKGRKTITTTAKDGGETINITLEETNDLTPFDDGTKQRVLNFSILTSFDGEKITRLNPVPVESSEIDLLNNPQWEWTITRSDGQPDSETVTFADGRVYKRTFSYTSNILTKRTKWERQ